MTEKHKTHKGTDFRPRFTLKSEKKLSLNETAGNKNQNKTENKAR